MGEIDYTFEWPLYPGVEIVIITGSFDQWSQSVIMERGIDSFKATVKIPLADLTYKYIVDGVWLTRLGDNVAVDPDTGIENNYVSREELAELAQDSNMSDFTCVSAAESDFQDEDYESAREEVSLASEPSQQSLLNKIRYFFH